MATIEEQIKAAEERAKETSKKLAQLKARKVKAEQRTIYSLTKGDRAEVTRKKILVGSFLLSSDSDPLNLKLGDKLFRDFLTRDDDRQLFGLEPLQKSDPVTEQVAPSATNDIRSTPVLLNVPIEEKDDAKALGARWNGEQKKWYVPAGVDVGLFAKWMPASMQ